MNAYRRYYSVDEGDASKPQRIVAIYTTLANSRGRQWVSPADLPIILDGGCGVVRVVYAVAEGKIISAICNGHP